MSDSFYRTSWSFQLTSDVIEVRETWVQTAQRLLGTWQEWRIKRGGRDESSDATNFVQKSSEISQLMRVASNQVDWLAFRTVSIVLNNLRELLWFSKAILENYLVFSDSTGLWSFTQLCFKISKVTYSLSFFHLWSALLRSHLLTQVTSVSQGSVFNLGCSILTRATVSRMLRHAESASRHFSDFWSQQILCLLGQF